MINSYKQSEVNALLKGSIDTHIHGFPDVIPRKLNDLELARDAVKAGMAGFIIKCHVAATEGMAWLVQQIVPEIRVWGGIALNHQVGGLNPEAVKISAKMGAKIVWMPTVSAASSQSSGKSSHLDAMGGGMKGAGISLYNEAGKLKSEVIEILQVIQQSNIILATGHLSTKEIFDLIDEALRQGVKKILINHPEGLKPRFTFEEQKKLAAKGVFFERCWSLTTNIGGEQNRLLPEEFATAIKAVGPASTVMASDHNQVINPPPVEGMRNYIEAMLGFGITGKDIETMVKYNPAQLVDL